MSHGMTIKEREHAFGVRGLKMCSPKLHKEYNKLKRENAAMRKWIIQENGGQRSVKKCLCLRCKKLRKVVTDL